jgi:two-component system, NarL family, invasion response regulator UvrY
VAHPIRVLLIDDEPMFLEAVRALLELDDRVQVVGSSSSGEEGVELARSARADVALVDFQLPTMDGVEITRRLLEQDAGIKVIAVTGSGDETTPAALRNAGATQYLFKGALHDEIVDAIVAVSRG